MDVSWRERYQTVTSIPVSLYIVHVTRIIIAIPISRNYKTVVDEMLFSSMCLICTLNVCLSAAAVDIYMTNYAFN